MKIRFAATFTLILMMSLLVLSACGEVKDGKYAGVAKCLTEKGVKFYGAFWCSHCSEQKKLFGDDIRYVDYVECDPRGENPKRDECIAAGVQSYPTWFFPGQDLAVGTKDPVELAKKANCEVGDLKPVDVRPAPVPGAVVPGATAPVTAEPQVK